MRIALVAPVALVLTLAAIACSQPVTGPSDVIGTVWRLVAIEAASGPSTVVTSPDRYTLEFLPGDRVAVRADCNVCNGSYSMARETLSIGLLACTRAFCGSESLDTLYTQVLGRPVTATRDQSLLVLRDSQTTLRFRSN